MQVRYGRTGHAMLMCWFCRERVKHSSVRLTLLINMKTISEEYLHNLERQKVTVVVLHSKVSEDIRVLD